MRPFRGSSVYWASLVGFALAVLLLPTRARADIILYDKDGWSFRTTGMIAAHYQLVLGPGCPKDPTDPMGIRLVADCGTATHPTGGDPPTSHGVLVGGKIFPTGAQDTTDNSLTLSRIRSGFIGTQIGFGAKRQINEDVYIDSLMAVNLNDISSNRNQNTQKEVDFREAWAALTTQGGTLKFGRMYSIFGSASAPVVLIAYQYGVGNPCLVSANTISCSSVGAGPLYAQFDAQLRYISPRLAGLELQFAVSDPVVGPGYTITPLPRFDGEINFDYSVNPDLRVRVIGQGVMSKVERVVQMPAVPARKESKTIWGAMGSAVLDAYGFSAGAGGWTGEGIGARTIFEIADGTNPLAYDASTGKLRKGRGLFGNVGYVYKGTGTGAAVGGGTFNMESNPEDKVPTSGKSVISQSREFHVTVTQKFDALTFIAEYMNWKNTWYWGEVQIINFMGVGANYEW